MDVVGCDHYVAKRIFKDAYYFFDDYYYARIVEGDKLELYKNGFVIHRTQ